MRYRRFGKTELALSVFSLGTMRCLASAEVAHATIQQAIAIGINHIETARGYGNSEIFLGRSLQTLNIPRNHLYITTKLPPTIAPDHLDQAIDQSLDRLQLTYIDCLAIHGLNTREHLQWVEQCLPKLQQAIAQGKIRHLGFSTHGPLDLIQAAMATGWFEFVYLHYYFFFQRNAPALQQAIEQDMGVFIISPADKGGLLHTPSQHLEQLCQPFSPLALTYRFLLSDRRITTLSVGPATPLELERPLGLANQTDPLTEAELHSLNHLVMQQQIALGTSQCSQCYECLPCPEDINIPEILRLRNLSVAYDMQAYGEYRYRMLENAGHWFPGNKGNSCTACGDCLPRCPESLNIPELLTDTHQRLNGKPSRRLWG